MRAIRISVLAIVPLAIQYEVVDGFTGMGAAALAISQSMFRKAVYLAAMLILPALAGIENVFLCRAGGRCYCQCGGSWGLFCIQRTCFGRREAF